MWIASCTNKRLKLLELKTKKEYSKTDYHEIMLVVRVLNSTIPKTNSHLRLFKYEILENSSSGSSTISILLLKRKKLLLEWKICSIRKHLVVCVFIHLLLFPSILSSLMNHVVLRQCVIETTKTPQIVLFLSYHKHCKVIFFSYFYFHTE